MSFNKQVYVRFSVDMVDALPHQTDAFYKFLQTGQENVEVPHPRGGMFRARFVKYDDERYCYYREDGTTVEVYLLEPARAGFIKRLTNIWE